jgi:hypothetical protein
MKENYKSKNTEWGSQVLELQLLQCIGTVHSIKCYIVSEIFFLDII